MRVHVCRSKYRVESVIAYARAVLCQQPYEFNSAPSANTRARSVYSVRASPPIHARSMRDE